ncbi:hypothetical protein TWF192_002758 [Orbilia oligospora]|nr:hypothetical protein TWF192_002758 [Orbilia oligospora]
MDNLVISQDGRWLYITGHGEPAKLDSHWRSPAKVPSASISYRNASTTAVGDDILNKYWISGLTFRGIMECTLYANTLHEEEEAD